MSAGSYSWLRLAAGLIAGLVPALCQPLPSARQAETAGDFATAEKIYEVEVARHPTAEGWQRLGLTRHLQNKFESAAPAFREAIRLSPALWTSRLFLGICLYRTNDFKSAREELVQAERLSKQGEPGREEVEYWLGATLIALKQPLAGLQWIERLLARAPGRVDALQLAAQAYADLGSGLWNQVAETKPDSAAGYEIDGHALEAEGNTAAALDAYRRSQSLNPRRPGPGAAMGRLLLQTGKAGEARTVLARELSLNPHDPDASYYAGLAALQMGQTAEAAKLLETAVAWARVDAEPAIALAQVYLAMGRREAAAEAARTALLLAPGSTPARELLAAAEQAK